MKVQTAVRNSTSPRRGSSALATVWLMGCLAVSGFFGWHFLSNENSTPTDGTVVTAPATAAAESSYETKSIRDIRIGERVLAHNPEVTDQERRQAVEPDSSWRHIHLEMKKPDDSVLKIELLRPRDWVVSHHAYAGTTIHLDLKEMGASGLARVVNIGRAPPLAKGSGQIVTGTFSHSAGNVINLYVDGLDEPIGTTDNHPFWSEDRQAFVPAGELKTGEHLLTEDGRKLLVTHSVKRRVDVAVFNLEVNVEHVYFVTQQGVLVHNSYNATRDDILGYYRSEPPSALGDLSGIQKRLDDGDLSLFTTQPIEAVVRNGDTIIVNGHHRLSAIADSPNFAGTVPITIRTDIVDDLDTFGTFGN